MGSFEITDNATGQSYACVEEQSLLVAMERMGKRLIQVGCRGGGCGRCRIQVLSGDYVTKKMSRKHISCEDESRQVVLACRAYPRSDLKIDVIGQPEIHNPEKP